MGWCEALGVDGVEVGVACICSSVEGVVEGVTKGDTSCLSLIRVDVLVGESSVGDEDFPRYRSPAAISAFSVDTEN